MNLPQLAADIASRIPAMAKDSPLNNAIFIEKLLRDAMDVPAEADIVLIQQKQIERLFDARNAEQALREKAEKERDALAAWKESAQNVESEWNPQAVAELLDLRVGSSIRAGIAPAIRMLKIQHGDMRTALARIYHDHFSGPDCRCRECHNRIKDLLDIQEA